MEILSSIFNSFILILPVIAVVAGGFAVFVFGFKNPAESKKINQKPTDSGTKKQQKKNQAKKKGNQGSPVKQQTTATTTTTAASSNQQKQISTKVATSGKNEVVKKVTPAVSAAPVKRADNPKTKSATDKKSKLAPAAAAPTPNVISTNKNKKTKLAALVNKSGDKKPVDFDDGNWFTVPTKLVKKKNKEDGLIPKVERKTNEKSTVGTNITGTASGGTGHLSSPNLNQKTLKDQANKVKKEAEAAAVEIKTPVIVVKEPAPVNHISIDEIPKIQSKIGFEFIINRKTIIEDAINDKKELNSDLSSVEKIDNIKIVDDAWKVLKD